MPIHFLELFPTAMYSGKMYIHLFSLWSIKGALSTRGTCVVSTIFWFHKNNIFVNVKQSFEYLPTIQLKFSFKSEAVDEGNVNFLFCVYIRPHLISVDWCGLMTWYKQWSRQDWTKIYHNWRKWSRKPTVLVNWTRRRSITITHAQMPRYSTKANLRMAHWFNERKRKKVKCIQPKWSYGYLKGVVSPLIHISDHVFCLMNLLQIIDVLCIMCK